MEHLTLVIPAKNEKESLPLVLKELQKYKLNIIIVLEKEDKETIQSISNFNYKLVFQEKKGYGSASVGFSYSEINFLIFSLFLILILNLLNHFFLGDSGSYLIAIFFGYLLISIYNTVSDISPYYIILLLWYPCFEILFSFLRKYLCNKSPMKPDNQHLHQLLFSFYKKKFFGLNEYYLNILSSISINMFNLLIINLASINPNLTTFQIKLIFFAVIIYFLIYFCLSKNLKLNLKK